MSLLTLLGITSYMIIGIILILVGILMAVFVPFIGKKVGFIMIMLGLILSVGFTVVENLVKDLLSNTVFLAVLIGVTAFGLIVWILFPQNKQ